MSKQPNKKAQSTKPVLFSLELDGSQIRHRILWHLAMLNMCAATVAFVVVPRFFGTPAACFFSYSLLVFFYSLLTCLFVSAFRYYKISTQGIEVNRDTLKLPRLLFPRRPSEYSLRDITSVEFLITSGKKHLVIAIKNKYPRIIESSLCKNEADLTQLQKQIYRYLDRDTKVKTSELIINSSRSWLESLRKEFAIAVLILFLLAVYTVTTWELQDSTLSEDIILIGANTQAIVKNLEIYRVFSSFILHYNVLHLLLNILVFAFFGQFVVRLLGTVRFLNIVLFSSMVAVLFSNVFSLADSSDASFGASGGAFGLLGAYTVIKFTHQGRIPALLNPMPDRIFILMLLVELFTSYYYENVDLYNHLGGYIAGVLIICLMKIDKEILFSKPAIQEKAACSAILAAYFWGIIEFLTRLYS